MNAASAQAQIHHERAKRPGWAASQRTPGQRSFKMQAIEPSRRAAGYARVSTDQQVEHGFSIDQQPVLLKEAADRDGILYTGTYIDPGRSGRTMHRPELERLLRDADRGEVQVLYIP